MAEIALDLLNEGEGWADPTYLISIMGEINADDSIKFIKETTNVMSALVCFESEGGNLWAGISLGKQIRAKGFMTIVKPNSECSSAAALAWLGGVKRFMASNSKLGFHEASIENDFGKTPSSMANAIMGAYLSDIGLSQETIALLVDTPHEEIMYLTFQKAKEYKIEVSCYDIQDEVTNISSEITILADIKAVEKLGQEFKSLCTEGISGLRAAILSLYDTATISNSLQDARDAYLLDSISSIFDANVMKNVFKTDNQPDFHLKKNVVARLEALLAHQELSNLEINKHIVNWWQLAELAFELHCLKASD